MEPKNTRIAECIFEALRLAVGNKPLVVSLIESLKILMKASCPAEMAGALEHFLVELENEDFKILLREHLLPLIQDLYGDSKVAWSGMFTGLVAEVVNNELENKMRVLVEAAKGYKGLIHALDQAIPWVNNPLDRVLPDSHSPYLRDYIPPSTGHRETRVIDMVFALGWHNMVKVMMTMYKMSLSPSLVNRHHLLMQLMLLQWHWVSAGDDSDQKEKVRAYRRLLELVVTSDWNPFQTGTGEAWEMLILFLIETWELNPEHFPIHLGWASDLLGAIPDNCRTTAAFQMLVRYVVVDEWGTTRLFKTTVLTMLEQLFGEEAVYPESLALNAVMRMVGETYDDSGGVYGTIDPSRVLEILELLNSKKGVDMTAIGRTGQNLLFWAITVGESTCRCCLQMGVPFIKDNHDDTAISWLLNQREAEWLTLDALLLCMSMCNYHTVEPHSHTIRSPIDPISERLPTIRHLFQRLCETNEGRLLVKAYPGYKENPLTPLAAAFLGGVVPLTSRTQGFLPYNGRRVFVTLTASTERQEGQLPLDAWLHILSFCGWNWFITTPRPRSLRWARRANGEDDTESDEEDWIHCSFCGAPEYRCRCD